MLAKILKTLRRAESSIAVLHQKVEELEQLATQVTDPQARDTLDKLINQHKQELEAIRVATQQLRIEYAIECGNASW
jgi:hypothetical protein